MGFQNYKAKNCFWITFTYVMKLTACSGSSRTILNLKDVVSRREAHDGTPERNNHMGACALLLLSPENVKR